MPCNSDHMEASTREKQRQQAAKFLIMVLEFRSYSVPAWVQSVADSYYGEGGEYAMVELCHQLRRLKEDSSAEFEQLVYGRTKESRRLANWWEDHCIEDAKTES